MTKPVTPEEALKTITLISLFVLTLNVAFSSDLPVCKDRKGNQLTGDINQVRKIMTSGANRPQILVNGVIESILPEDNQGLPHQKFIMNVSGIKMQIVSNLDFGRIPLAVGTQLQVCGEFLYVGSGMVHWTHFDPHGGHPDGFTVLGGKLYGNTENQNH